MDVRAMSSGVGNAAAGLTTAARVIQSRADVAYAFASLLRTQAKGNFGEIYAQHYFVRDKLGEAVSKRWVSLTPRVGSQGFDHLFVRMERGKFRWMVCESKFKSSQLGRTDGRTVRQMSWVWIHKRAGELGDAYLKIADLKSIQQGKMPLFKGGIKSYQVPLSDDTKVTFWKGKDGKWHFDGTPDQLAEAQDKARAMGIDLKSPTCNIRGRRFRIKTNGDDVYITLDEVKSEAGSKEVRIVKGKKPLKLAGVLNKKISDAELKKVIEEEIHRRYPELSPQEVKELVAEIAERKSNGSLLEKAMSTTGSIALESAISAAVSGTLDATIQYLLTRKVDVHRIVLTAGATFAGTAAGQVVSIVFIKTKGGVHAVRVVSRFANLRSASLMRSSLAGGVGAVVTSAVTAYGSLWLGRSSLKEANQEFITGVSGTAGGALAVTGVTSAVAAWGSASTGTAICALGGAAQTNAILAWIGMGGGKVVGGVVLGGVGVVVGIAVSAAVSFAISKYNASVEREYVLAKGNVYARPGVWDLVAGRVLSAH